MAGSLDCNRSMSVTGPRSNLTCNPVRQSMREKSSLNQLRSVAGTTRLLDLPDVRIPESDMANQEVLTWDNTLNKFANTSIQTIAVGSVITPYVREIFIKNGGDNGNISARSTADAVADFDVGIGIMSKFTSALQQVQIWVTGNVNFNTNNENGAIVGGSIIGNTRRGISIRGLDAINTFSQLSDTAGPRGTLSQLVSASGPTFSQDTALTSSLTDTNLKLNSWTSNASMENIYFIRNSQNSSSTENVTFPVAVDGTTIDGITANQRIFLATSNTANPIYNNTYNKLTFPAKVTCNNNGDSSNRGFFMTGDVQFQDIHFELQNDVETPFAINGEFQIMYSLFSNTVIGGASTTTTLSLSASGYSQDALGPSGTQVNGGSLAIVPDKPIIKVNKSVFQDLVIKINSPCDFKDCVFIRCHITNPRGATFTSCTFYDNRGIFLGDPTKNDEFQNNSMNVTRSYFMYGKDVGQITTNNGANLSINECIWRPAVIDGNPQTNPLLSLSYKSTCRLEKIYIPDSLDATGSDDVASILSSTDSTVTISDLNALGGASDNSFIRADNSNVELARSAGVNYWNTCTNAAPILYGRGSNIKFTTFEVDMGADMANTDSDSGLFRLVNCDIKADDKFILDVDVANTTAVLLHLTGCTLNNYSNPSDPNAYNFNLLTNPLALILKAYNSNINLNTGDIGGTQVAFNARAYFDNTIFNVNGYSQGSWSAADNLNWTADTVASDYIFEAENNSLINLNNVDLDPVTASAGNKSTAFSAHRNTTVNIYHSKINVNGVTGKISIKISDNSTVSIIDSEITILLANNKPCIKATQSSTLKIINSDSSTERTITCGTNLAADCERAITVTEGSHLYISGMHLTTQSPKGITISGNSTATIRGDSNVTPLLQSLNAGAGSNLSNSVLDVQESNLFVERVTFDGGNGASAIRAKKLSRVSGHTLGLTNSNLSADAIIFESGTVGNLGGTNTVTTNIMLGGTDAANRFTYSDLVANKIVPGQTYISDGTGVVYAATVGCSATGASDIS